MNLLQSDTTVLLHVGARNTVGEVVGENHEFARICLRVLNRFFTDG